MFCKYEIVNKNILLHSFHTLVVLNSRIGRATRAECSSVLKCDSLAELFVLPPSITEMRIEFCNSLKFTWAEEAESKSVHVQQLDTSTPLENRPSTDPPVCQSNQ
jgi:hypothetical protein